MRQLEKEIYWRIFRYEKMSKKDLRIHIKLFCKKKQSIINMAK